MSVTEYEIQGRYRLTIAVNGELIRWTENVLKKITICEGFNFSLPTMDLEVVNKGRMLDLGDAHDAAEVVVTLWHQQLPNREEPDDILRYRVFDYQIGDTTMEGVTVKMACVADAKPMFESRIESVEGTASDVFAHVAGQCGLVAEDLDPSSDAMVWLRCGVRGSRWLDEVCRHAWAGPDSCFVWTVGRGGRLLFRNITPRMGQTYWRFKKGLEVDPSPLGGTELHYESPSFRSLSGTLNAMHGYGRTYSSFNVLTGEWVPHVAESFRKTTQQINVHAAFKKPQRVEMRPPFLDNTHEFYQDAAAQNLRYRAIYSTMVRCSSTTPRNVRLCDGVLFEHYDHPARRDRPTYAGAYLVSHITTEIMPDTIVRTFTLLREGVNVGVGGLL